MKLNKPYTNKQYADLAIYCNENGLIIEDKGDYLEAVEPPYIPPTKEEIRATREQLFSSSPCSDYKYDYEEAVARYGAESEQAKQTCDIWLAEKDKIRKNNPYPDEVTNEQ